MGNKPEGKFRMTPWGESGAAQQFTDCNVFYVDSAVWIATAICGCSRNQLLEAVRAGSLHAHDFSEYFGNDGRNADMNHSGRGRHAIEAGQTRKWPMEHEAENFVYLTGLFLRLAIQSENVTS